MRARDKRGTIRWGLRERATVEEESFIPRFIFVLMKGYQREKNSLQDPERRIGTIFRTSAGMRIKILFVLGLFFLPLPSMMCYTTPPPRPCRRRLLKRVLKSPLYTMGGLLGGWGSNVKPAHAQLFPFPTPDQYQWR